MSQQQRGVEPTPEQDQRSVAISAAISSQVSDQVSDQVADAVREQVRDQRSLAISASISTQVADQVTEQQREAAAGTWSPPPGVVDDNEMLNDKNTEALLEQDAKNPVLVNGQPSSSTAGWTRGGANEARHHHSCVSEDSCA